MRDIIAFSCLSGDKKGLRDDLGTLFTPKRILALEKALEKESLLVFVDDLEPRRIWLWDTPQQEITGWLELVIEGSFVPDRWKVILWSHLESRNKGMGYEKALQTIQSPQHALTVHRLETHMRAFPNKKANFSGNKEIREATLRRAAHYALQGAVLEDAFPSGVLFQTETPWKVKDPLFGCLRRKQLQIIHPFEERR